MAMEMNTQILLKNVNEYVREVTILNDEGVPCRVVVTFLDATWQNVDAYGRPMGDPITRQFWVDDVDIADAANKVNQYVCNKIRESLKTAYTMNMPTAGNSDGED